MSKKAINDGLLFKCLIVLFVLSLFFPIRHVFLTHSAFLTGQYSDFTSFSLYLSDIVIFITWVFLILSRVRAFYHVVESFKLLILAVFLSFLVHFTLKSSLNLYLLLKWLELVVSYGTLVVILKEFDIKWLILKLFAWLVSLQSVIALIQFAKQSPIGLFKVGEYHIGPVILGVAKIVSGGTTFIRGYGTFPHPNPLSAFLVAGILINLYLLLNSQSLRARIAYSILIFLNILGLTVTFSRGAYLSLALGLIIFFGYLVWDKIKLLSWPLAVVALSILVSFIIFKPFLLARATFSDQSTMDRKFYDVIGVKMAIKNPLFGVGLGESLLHMEQYSGKTLQPWDKQPPHNYFVLAAAELGIPAALILLWIFIYHLKSLILNLKSKFTPYSLLLTSIFCSFLLLMMFDHYFYTLDQTQLLLWLILAIIAAEKKSPNWGLRF